MTHSSTNPKQPDASIDPVKKTDDVAAANQMCVGGVCFPKDLKPEPTEHAPDADEKEGES